MRGKLVGRGREINAAFRALDATICGWGSVFVLAGEAGIGKSRLAEEIAGIARNRGMEVVWSGGWPGGGPPPYWPWPEVLGAIESPSDSAPRHSSTYPSSERTGWFRSVAAALRERARRRPLLVVLDDAHTIDPDGLLLTRFVARTIVGHPVSLLLTHRTTPEVSSLAAKLLSEIGREGMVSVLSGLRREEIRDLIVETEAEPSVEVIERVEQLTGGNPFLVEQAMDAGLHRSPGPVPPAALQFLDMQFETLDATTRSVLEAAAVLGTGATTLEVSTVVSSDAVIVDRARDLAARAGLIRADRATPIAFTHDLAREAVLARLGPDELADIHRRCVVMLGSADNSPEHCVRRARHALALARCSSAETAFAVDLARSSAELLQRSGSPAGAAELLTEALAVHEAAGLRSTGTLLTELGSAILATGRLTDAREIFRRAVAYAGASGDTVTYARAALGLGGVWVQEHRSLEERRRFDDIVDRAIAGLFDDPGPEPAGLLASLRLRQVAERAALGLETVDNVRAAVEAVRSHGDQHQLAAGLSLLHHVMLGPAHARDRASVADEMIEVARSCGDELQTLTGTLWRVVDQLLLGEDADQALVQLRERADTLGMQAIVFIADSIAVMGLMRDGYLRQAEMAADRCLAAGIEVGDADASVYYGAQILAARWYAGNTADLLDVAEGLTRSSVMPPENKVFLAVVAAMAAGSGDVDRAERAISAIGRHRLRDILPSSSWMVTVFALIEAAGALGDRGLSEELYDLLAPHADLPILASVGVCCFGSAERSLGLAARTAGRIDAAVSHLERAVVNNTKMGNRPMTAITRAELAEVLAARAEPGDRDRAADLFTRAIEMAETMGLEARKSGWIRCRDELESGDSGVAAVCTRMGGEWELVTGAEHAYVRHTVGMSYISALLAAPHAEIPAGELAGISVLSTGQEVLDSRALRTVRLRQQELQEELSVAARLGRPERSDRCQRQLRDLEEYLRTATGPSGRRRRFDDATERARTSVQKAVSRAIDNISREAPRLGDDLRMSIRTGYKCSYEPRRGAPQRWRIQAQ